MPYPLPHNTLVLDLGNLVLGDFVPKLLTMLTDATRGLIAYHKTFTLKGYNVYNYMYRDAQQQDASSCFRQPTV